MLLSKSDGIEVSYNACGVIANLMSDGPDVWTAVSPSRYKVLDRMVLAITSWPLSQKRNINYRYLSYISLIFISVTVNWGARFRKILSQSYDNLRIFVQLMLILRQIHDSRANTLNIVNITKYINVNIKTSLSTSSHDIIGKYVMLCN